MHSRCLPAAAGAKSRSSPVAFREITADSCGKFSYAYSRSGACDAFFRQRPPARYLRATRLAKSSMLDALSQDYVRTAKAKGVAKWKVIFKHALRNSLLPIITYAGPQIAYIITGSMVIETIFTVGGIGSKFVSAISNRDYTMIMATTIFLATLMVVANVICDLLYKVVDPRIKFD